MESGVVMGAIFRCSAAIMVAMLCFPAIAQQRQAVNLAVGESTTLKLAHPARAIVLGNPAIADISVENAKTVTIVGKKTGGTLLTIRDAKGNALVDATIVVAAGGAGTLAVTYATGKDVKPGGEVASWVCAGALCSRQEAVGQGK
jgi:Flp pilus assembly secretin CpaC